MTVICASEKDAQTLIDEAKNDDITAIIVGHTTDIPEITIASQFMKKKNISFSRKRHEHLE